MVQIGCTSHSASVRDVNGGIVSSASALVEVSYSRVLNDVSTATIRIAPDGDCCGTLGLVRSWRHWLWIDQEGTPAWSGPIVNVQWLADEVVINAVDILGLLDRRVPHQSKTFTDTDLTDIAEFLIDDGFAPDDPGHTVTVIGGKSGVTGGREYEINIGQTADHLRDLAETGIDFTVLGSTVVLLSETFCDVVGRIADADLPEGLRVTEDGASLVTRWVVAGSDDSGVVGTAGGTDTYYGLLEKYEQQTSVTTQAAADSSAAAKLRASRTAPVFIDTSQVTLSPLTNIPAESLVPGWCVDVTSTATCRDIIQRLKITGVQVTESAGSVEDPGEIRTQIQVAAPGLTTAQVLALEGGS